MTYNIKSIKEDFKAKGIFYTPKEQALYIKSFLPSDISEVYDPTCGDGALLEVFEDKIIKYGQDINEEQVNIAKNKIKNFNGEVGDTLIIDKFQKKQFDYIVANPPFSIKWEQNSNDNRFRIAPALAPKCKADYAFILHILSKLTNKGIAVVMGFPGILYRGNAELKIRQWLVENNFIEKIVAISGNKFIDTKISTCILVLNKNKKDNDILFIDDELKKENIISFNEIKSNDYNLSVNLYIKEEKKEYKINAFDLQNKSRQEMYFKLKKDLQIDEVICKLENWDNNQYLDSLIKLIKSFKTEIQRNIVARRESITLPFYEERRDKNIHIFQDKSGGKL